MTSNDVVASSVVLLDAIVQADELQLAQHEVWLALLHYKWETVLRRFISQADSEKARLILQLRNAVKQPGEAEKTRLHRDRISPEKGHESMRVAAGYGEQDSRHYIDLRFRPAFHDLLDAPQGYVDGAAINMFDARFKWFVGNGTSNNLRLESLSLFNVFSINPLQRWRKPLSWKLDFRFDLHADESDAVSEKFYQSWWCRFQLQAAGVNTYCFSDGRVEPVITL